MSSGPGPGHDALELPSSLSFLDRALYVKAESTLVLADVHLGRDETSGVQFRLGEHEDVTGRFEALCARFDPDEVVVAGDLLHSFSSLPRGVTETLRELREIAEGRGARVVVTPGNHDTMLSRLWDGPTEREYPVGDWLVCHGHEHPVGSASGYVVGHDHPTIEIAGKRRPCYLYGEGVYEGGDVLMLPAFTRLAAGVPVNGASVDLQSPLVGDLDPFRPIVRDEGAEETLTFPPLGRFRGML
jgi:hypothetical protein